jgi:hypothetical protein
MWLAAEKMIDSGQWLVLARSASLGLSHTQATHMNCATSGPNVSYRLTETSPYA